MLEKKGRKRRNYIKWTAEERAEIGQHAVRHGLNQTVRLLKGKYRRLTKQTVSDFKKAFIQAKQTAVGPVNEITFRKRGRPALLPDDLMKKTIEMIQALRLNGAPVTAVVINAIDKGIVIANDRTLLVEHGGYLSLSFDWGRNVLCRMEREGKKMAVRIATTEKHTRGSWTFEGSETVISAKDQNTISHAPCARRCDSQFRPNPIVLRLFR